MTEPVPEFSRLASRGEIARGGLVRDIEANERERAALARRFDLVALDRLAASLRLEPHRDGRLLLVEGHLSAALTQRCVVTLEDLPAALEVDFTRLFTLASEAVGGGEVEIDAEAEDLPEPVGPRGIDLGETVAEQLALALDPYPRAPGADLEAQLDPRETLPPDGPFAALAALKRRQ